MVDNPLDTKEYRLKQTANRLIDQIAAYPGHPDESKWKSHLIELQAAIEIEELEAQAKEARQRPAAGVDIKAATLKFTMRASKKDK